MNTIIPEDQDQVEEETEQQETQVCNVHVHVYMYMCICTEPNIGRYMYILYTGIYSHTLYI